MFARDTFRWSSELEQSQSFLSDEVCMSLGILGSVTVTRTVKNKGAVVLRRIYIHSSVCVSHEVGARVPLQAWEDSVAAQSHNMIRTNKWQI